MTPKPVHTGLGVAVLVVCALVVGHAQTDEEWPIPRSFQSDGVRIHYIDEGQAWRLGSRASSAADSRPRGNPSEPVLLTPGFWQGTREWYDVIAALIASRYRVIAYDGRGTGRSGKPSDVGLYGSEAVADGVRLLDYLGVERTHVIGYSDGGDVALRIGIGQPDRVLSLTLVGYGTPNPMQTLSVTEQAAVIAGIEQGDAEPLLRARLPAGWDAPSQGLISAYNRGLGGEDLSARAASLRGLFSMPRISRADLGANAVPALSLVGDRDFMRRSVDAMAVDMSNLEVLVVPDADHTAVLGTRFVREVLTFLSAHREAGQ